MINNLKKVFSKLFPTDASTGLEIIEFLTDIDLGLSHECSVALFTIITEIRKYELWAIKCEINNIFYIELIYMRVV